MEPPRDPFVATEAETPPWNLRSSPMFTSCLSPHVYNSYMVKVTTGPESQWLCLRPHVAQNDSLCWPLGIFWYLRVPHCESKCKGLWLISLQTEYLKIHNKKKISVLVWNRPKELQKLDLTLFCKKIWRILDWSSLLTRPLPVEAPQNLQRGRPNHKVSLLWREKWCPVTSS